MSREYNIYLHGKNYNAIDCNFIIDGIPLRTNIQGDMQATIAIENVLGKLSSEAHLKELNSKIKIETTLPEDIDINTFLKQLSSDIELQSNIGKIVRVSAITGNMESNIKITSSVSDIALVCYNPLAYFDGGRLQDMDSKKLSELDYSKI